eukprot:COSAG01_NODE_5146_length_4453_cov_10.678916_3_plen_227_part_00
MDGPAPEPETGGAPAAAGIPASRPLWASEGWWAGTRREDELGAWLTLLGLSGAEAAAVSERFTQLGMPEVTLTELASDLATVEGEHVTRFWLERNGILLERQEPALAIVQQGSRGLETMRELFTDDGMADDLAEIAKEMGISDEAVAQCREQLAAKGDWWSEFFVSGLGVGPTQTQQFRDALKDLRQHSAVDFALHSTVLPKWPRWRPRRRVTLCIGNDSCTRPLL